MNAKKYDFIIVGLGIAGINMSYELMNRGYSVYHIHQSLPGESTKVAAGLINPITGRRFVKSWMIEEVMPFAEARYRDFEKLLNGKYLKRIHIVRGLKSAEDENNWLSQSSDQYLAEFLMDKAEMNGLSEKLELPELLAELKNCFKIELAQLQIDYINFLKEKNLLKCEKFDFENLQISKQKIQYKDISADKIIFAEGWKVLDNPFFQVPAFAPTKGELMICYSEELQLEKAYKKDMFITPIGQGYYWCGATSEWNNFDPEVSEKMKNRLLEFLESTLKCNYKIIHHLAGIRPASKNRRPILGSSPTYNNVFIFNGMGTKGSSLAPFFSQMLADYILLNKPIENDLDIQNFFLKS